VGAGERAGPEQKLEVRYRDEGQLELREQGKGAGEVLPNELAMRWENGFLDEEESADGGVSLKHVDKNEGEDEGKFLGWDDEEDEDITGCSNDCGYCGRCTY